MSSLPAVIVDPSRDLELGMGHTLEPRLVEQFVPPTAIEALNIATLHCPSWRGLLALDADLGAPCRHGVAIELGVIVADDHASSRTTRRQSDVTPFPSWD